LFNLIINLEMCSFQDNVLSIVKPRKVVLFKLEIIELEEIPIAILLPTPKPLLFQFLD
jgi:hypothetical protein